MNEQPIEDFSAISEKLFELASKVEVLKHLAWPVTAKEDFFRSNATLLPKIEYPKLSFSDELKAIDQLESKLESDIYSNFLLKNINSLRTTYKMLESLGKKAFFENSKKIYGAPCSKLKDEKSTSLDMARNLLSITGKNKNLSKGNDACILAEELAEKMQESVTRFGELAPEIKIVEQLSANALASAQSVKIRQGACFSDKDIGQLIEHEINVHVATILNGKTQKKCMVLGTNLPSTTKTQEGLAVFSEIITGNIDVSRLRRLAHRVITIQMAIEGADFIDVYRYFLENGVSEEQAFENSRRVFRGGIITGGAPFTKDVVYLDGLLRMHNFLRAAIRLGHTDYVKLLFVGRMDIEDLPVIKKLSELNYCEPAKFLPYWVRDNRFLVSYLSYSSLLNMVDMKKVNHHYEEMLSQE